MPSVIDVAQLGARLHVLVDPLIASPIDMLMAKMREKSLAAEMRKISPNLEDVFVMATHGLVPK